MNRRLYLIAYDITNEKRLNRVRYLEGERGCYLKKGGRKRFYPLYEEWAKAMRPYFAKSVRALAKRLLNGEAEETPEWD